MEAGVVDTNMLAQLGVGGALCVILVMLILRYLRTEGAANRDVNKGLRKDIVGAIEKINVVAVDVATTKERVCRIDEKMDALADDRLAPLEYEVDDLNGRVIALESRSSNTSNGHGG